jgi:hypothetical protein
MKSSTCSLRRFIPAEKLILERIPGTAKVGTMLGGILIMRATETQL